jgi:hypothetical protein
MIQKPRRRRRELGQGAVVDSRAGASQQPPGSHLAGARMSPRRAHTLLIAAAEPEAAGFAAAAGGGGGGLRGPEGGLANPGRAARWAVGKGGALARMRGRNLQALHGMKQRTGSSSTTARKRAAEAPQ